MGALERAKKQGDTKFLQVAETYNRLQAGEITKPDAINILGEGYRNTVTMWKTN